MSDYEEEMVYEEELPKVKEVVRPEKQPMGRASLKSRPLKLNSDG